MKTYQNYINGRFVEDTGSARISVQNPATGQSDFRCPGNVGRACA